MNPLGLKETTEISLVNLTNVFRDELFGGSSEEKSADQLAAVTYSPECHSWKDSTFSPSHRLYCQGVDHRYFSHSSSLAVSAPKFKLQTWECDLSLGFFSQPG